MNDWPATGSLAIDPLSGKYPSRCYPNVSADANKLALFVYVSGFQTFPARVSKFGSLSTPPPYLSKTTQIAHEIGYNDTAKLDFS